MVWLGWLARQAWREFRHGVGCFLLGAFGPASLDWEHDPLQRLHRDHRAANLADPNPHRHA